MPLLLPFILATTILLLIPGPNVALIVANSLAYGRRFGLITVAGTASAMLIQLVLTCLGLAQLLGGLSIGFAYVRWIGVVYLFYLAVQQWFAPPADLTQTRPQNKSPRAIFLRGFLVSLTNPKTLFFYGAFFPQFIASDKSLPAQMLILSLTFLFLAIVLDSSWAFLAARACPLLFKQGRLRNRLSAGVFAGAGLGLALARKK